jgi:geranylgeranyl transferase type-1 subunit beta
LCGRLSGISDKERLQRWLLSRQQSSQGGFNGRTEKAEDVCYSFWNGASAHILALHDLLSSSEDVDWLLRCQTAMGGISKTPDELPDVMHSYLALAALSMHGQEGDGRVKGKVKPIEPRLNISLDSLEWLRNHM